MNEISVLSDAGIKASIESAGRLRLSGLSRLSGEQKSWVINFAKSHKQAIIGALSQICRPGQCESCPAAGYWDYSNYAGQGLLCFHYAYYLGKPGRPKPCLEMRERCPRKDNR